jgi:hypothetical protein
MTYTIKQQITRDLAGLDVNDSDSHVRRYFRLFIEGSYANGNGEQVQADNLKTLRGIFWDGETRRSGVRKQMRSWVINQFVRNCMADYGGSYSHVQKCIVDSMSKEKLEELTTELVLDAVEWMHSASAEV